MRDREVGVEIFNREIFNCYIEVKKDLDNNKMVFNYWF